MADRGHELTDEILNNLETRIADEYAVATRDMQRKLREYMEKFKAEDEKQKALLKAGKITKKEYKDWRYRHMMVGKRWEAMKDVLAQDLEHASDIALKIAGEKMADVYALNANFATYQIEHDAKIDTGFTLYNHDTAEYLLKDERQLMPGPSTRKAKEIAANEAMQWDKQKIQSAVLQGVLQGEGPHKVAERLRQVGQMGYNASVRYARTMTTSAQNAGRYNSFRRARDLGVDLTIEWMATLDGRTRHAHRMMHGQRTTVDEPFHTPDGYTIYYPADSSGMSDAPQQEIWNCFVGETVAASDSEIVRSYKHKYSGELFHIKTSRGVEFTCTPNHPILTPRGWIAANALYEGDDILVTRVGEFDSSGLDPNINHVFPSMKAIHQFMNMLPGKRASGLSVNFHGDRATANVEVVSKKRFLRDNINSSSTKTSDEFRFKNAGSFVFCKSHFVPCLGRIYISALRLVRKGCESLTLFRRSLFHAGVHRFGEIAGRDSCVSEYAIDNLPAMTDIRGELLDGLTGKVFTDNIVAIDRQTRRLFCHVYNLQTKNGYYFVRNSISCGEGKSNDNYYAIAKNCRCTLRAMVKGYERETIRNSPKMEDMTFEEWVDAKEIPDTQADRKQFNDYKSLLGRKAPKTYREFQDIKYNNPEQWQNLKKAASDKRRAKKNGS